MYIHTRLHRPLPYHTLPYTHMYIELITDPDASAATYPSQTSTIPYNTIPVLICNIMIGVSRKGCVTA